MWGWVKIGGLLKLGGAKTGKESVIVQGKTKRDVEMRIFSFVPCTRKEAEFHRHSWNCSENSKQFFVAD